MSVSRTVGVEPCVPGQQAASGFRGPSNADSAAVRLVTTSVLLAIASAFVLLLAAFAAGVSSAGSRRRGCRSGQWSNHDHRSAWGTTKSPDGDLNDRSSRAFAHSQAVQSRARPELLRPGEHRLGPRWAPSRLLGHDDRRDQYIQRASRPQHPYGQGSSSPGRRVRHRLVTGRVAVRLCRVHAFANPVGSIYTVRADGSGRTRLKTGSAGHDASPSWSPGGKRLVYETNAAWEYSVRLRDRFVWVVGVDGKDRHLVARNAADPAWSPNGRMIAYRAFCGIKLVTPAGRDVTPPTGARRCRAIGVAGQPVWSPDGRKIAIGNRRGVYVMNADGSNLSTLTLVDPTGIFGFSRPTWQPLPH